MAKVWINPAFKDKIKKPEEKLQEDIKKENKQKKDYIKQKLPPQTKKIFHSENYFNKRIKENSLVEASLVNKIIITGTIEWTDQKYIKLIEAKTGDHIVLDRRFIKYISKKDINQNLEN